MSSLRDEATRPKRTRKSREKIGCQGQKNEKQIIFPCWNLIQQAKKTPKTSEGMFWRMILIIDTRVFHRFLFDSQRLYSFTLLWFAFLASCGHITSVLMFLPAKINSFSEKQRINPYFVDVSAISSLRWPEWWLGFMAAVCVAGVPLCFTACLMSYAPTGLGFYCRFTSLRGGTTKQSRTSTNRGLLYRRKNT